jgi:hypothetical protein
LSSNHSINELFPVIAGFVHEKAQKAFRRSKRLESIRGGANDYLMRRPCVFPTRWVPGILLDVYSKSLSLRRARAVFPRRAYFSLWETFFQHTWHSSLLEISALLHFVSWSTRNFIFNLKETNILPLYSIWMQRELLFLFYS